MPKDNKGSTAQKSDVATEDPKTEKYYKRIKDWSDRVKQDLSDLAQDSIPKLSVTRHNPLLHREKNIKR